jgi:hypothetical protein
LYESADATAGHVIVIVPDPSTDPVAVIDDGGLGGATPRHASVID